MGAVWPSVDLIFRWKMSAQQNKKHVLHRGAVGEVSATELVYPQGDLSYSGYRSLKYTLSIAKHTAAASHLSYK